MHDSAYNPPFDLEQIAKVTEIQFANAGLVAVAAKSLKGLIEAYADEAASTKAKGDQAVERCMQDMANGESRDATTSGATCAADSDRTKESDAQKGDEGDASQTTAMVSKEGAPALSVRKHRKQPHHPERYCCFRWCK